MSSRRTLITDAAGTAKKSPAAKLNPNSGSSSSFTITSASGVLARSAGPPPKAMGKPTKEPIKIPETRQEQPPPVVNTGDGGVEGDSKALPDIAKNLLKEALAQMEQSGNIKTSIKEKVTENLRKMYKVVLDMKQEQKTEILQLEKRHADELLALAGSAGGNPAVDAALERVSKEIKELTEAVHKLKTPAVVLPEMKELVEAVKEQGLNAAESRRHIEAISVQMNEHCNNLQTVKAVEGRPSYAEMASRATTHSIIVSSTSEEDTSEEVLNKIRTTMDARTSGVQVDGVRKVRNRRVLLSCQSEAQISRVKERLRNSEILRTEEATNKDPLVIIKDVFNYNTDEDILKSLKTQNKHIVGDISEGDYRVAVRYRKKARNPLQGHVVLRVSPKVWSRLLDAGEVHIDLQRRPVRDQTPLVQCTKCLGFGHGRRLCKEAEICCSYCAGPHLRADCPAWTLGDFPTCRNCMHAKYERTDHGAFDDNCPIKIKWDALARSSVAYC